MTYTMSATDRARIAYLHPSMRRPIEDTMRIGQGMLDLVQPGRYRMSIFRTWASRESQQKLYMQGRKQLENGTWLADPKSHERIVTNATPDKTPHCAVDRGDKPSALAADLWIVNASSGEILPDGAIAWAIIPAAAYHAAPDFLESGAFFGTIKGGDWPHLQRKGWRDLVRDGVVTGG